jgi:S1-C subfamily serine protease
MSYDEIARATVQVHGEQAGSGFHFLRSDVIVTNHHVVGNRVQDPSLYATAEGGHRFSLQYVRHSPQDEHDFAIYRIDQVVPPDRVALQPPSDTSAPERGRDVLFAGYPHGISALLVQQAVVAGPTPKGFYLDGSVNEGNSGGPVVDRATGEVLGIVTQRRFPGEQALQQTVDLANQIIGQLSGVTSQGQQPQPGTVQIMGVDFGQLVQSINQYQVISAQASRVLAELLRANANSGLGVGFNIEYVLNECRTLNIA